MADVTVTPVDLDPNTRSIDLIAGGSSVTAGQTFAITALGNTRSLIIVLEEQGGGAATVTFDAGDNPPSFLAAAVDVALATSDLRIVMLEPGQFIQDSQTGPVNGSVATNTVKIYALRISNEI